MIFSELYELQCKFQNLIGEKEVPRDDPEMMAHHLLGLVTEIGEVSQEDKRWKKNKRNKTYNKDGKCSEIADCFIFLLNVCIYSDISPDRILEEIKKKILINIERYKNDSNS